MWQKGINTDKRRMERKIRNRHTKNNGTRAARKNRKKNSENNFKNELKRRM
jgi:hypothetical protein